MMKSMFYKHGVTAIEQLLDLAKEAGVKLIVCQMSMDVMRVKQSNIVDEVEFGGSATWLDHASDAQINLFI